MIFIILFIFNSANSTNNNLASTSTATVGSTTTNSAKTLAKTTNIEYKSNFKTNNLSLFNNMKMFSQKVGGTSVQDASQADKQVKETIGNEFASNLNEPNKNMYDHVALNDDFYNDIIDYNSFNLSNFDLNQYIKANNSLFTDLNYNYFSESVNNANKIANGNVLGAPNEKLLSKSNCLGFEIDNDQKLNDYLIEMTNYYRNLDVNFNNSNVNVINLE